MYFWRLLGVFAASLTLAACGTHGAFDAQSPTSTTPTNSSTTTYNYVAPQVNSQKTYVKTIIDNSNSTISETVVETIIVVNKDSSFVVQSDDPGHNATTVNGTTYSVPTDIININNSEQETSYTETSISGASVTCTLTPHGDGPNYPITVGDTWSSSWNLTCGSDSLVSYAQTGSIVDTESITVPAGTFTTFKLQSTISWTDAQGTTHTDSRTTWKDVSSDHVTIKEQDSYVLAGTTPTNGYPVTITKALQKKS